MCRKNNFQFFLPFAMEMAVLSVYFCRKKALGLSGVNFTYVGMGLVCNSSSTICAKSLMVVVGILSGQVDTNCISFYKFLTLKFGLSIDK